MNKKIVSIFLGSAGIQIISVILSLITGVVLAKAIGVTGIGVYSYALALLSILAIVVEFGLPSFLLKQVSHFLNHGSIQNAIQTLNWSKRLISFSFLLVSLALVIYFFFQNTSLASEWTAILGLPLVYLTATMRLNASFLSAMKHVVISQIPELIFKPLVFLVLLVFTFLYSASPQLVMTLNVISALLALLYAHFNLKRLSKVYIENKSASLQSFSEEIKNVDSKNWLKTSVPMGLTEGARVLLAQIIFIILNIYSSEFEIGIFRVALQIGLLVSLPITIGSIVLAPYVVQLTDSDKKKSFIKNLSTITAFVFVCSVLSALFLIFIGEEIILYFFGTNFISAYKPMVIIALGQVLHSLWGPAAIVLNLSGFEKTVSAYHYITFIVLVLSSITLVTRFGVNGAAIANVISMSVLYITLWIAALAKVKINTSIFTLNYFVRDEK